MNCREFSPQKTALKKTFKSPLRALKQIGEREREREQFRFRRRLIGICTFKINLKVIAFNITMIIVYSLEKNKQ